MKRKIFDKEMNDIWLTGDVQENDNRMSDVMYRLLSEFASFINSRQDISLNNSIYKLVFSTKTDHKNFSIGLKAYIK